MGSVRVRAVCAVLLPWLCACGGDRSPAAPAPGSATLDVAPLPPLSVERRSALEQEIARLAQVRSERIGYSTGWVGTPGGFAPRDDDHADEPVLRLVEAGPEAIPLLLSHLGDATPTTLVFGGKEQPVGGMWRSAEIPYDPDDPDEKRAVEEALPEGDRVPPTERGDVAEETHRRYLEKHVLTVGDVCFAVLGEITNRDYESVHGAGTMNLVVNSPVLDPRIAQAVRAMWSGRDPRQTLAARLARDVRRRQEVEWRPSPRGAVVRLAYYFPRESEGLLGARADALWRDAHGPGAPADEDAADAHAILETLARVPSEPVREAVRRALRRTRSAGDVLVVGVLLPGTTEQALSTRLARAIAKEGAAPDPGDPSLEDDLLRAADVFPFAAPQILFFLAQRRGEAGWKWAFGFVDRLDAPRRLPFLRPLLDVEEFWSDAPSSAGGPSPKPLRVEDRAAVRVAALRPDLPFDVAALHHQRGERIRAMIEALDRESR